MSVINATPLLAAAGGDYQISRSVRLRSSASAYFNRTPASAGNRRTWTWSAWVKRGVLGTFQGLFGGGGASPNYDALRFTDTNTLQFYTGGAASVVVATTAVFRDPSAWYHIVLQFNTTEATASNRVILFVNGVAQTLTGTFPNQNTDWNINTANTHAIGAQAIGGIYNLTADAYITEVHFIDGQAVNASFFGETDVLTGVWKPKRQTQVSYGTNGFFLNFSDNSSNTATTIGKDYSGNGNNWTPNNISVTAGVTYDSMLDVPTMYADGGNGRGNYAVINPLDKATNIAVAQGNLNATNSGAAGWASGRCSIAVSSGKWYWEIDQTYSTGGPLIMGIADAAFNPSTQRAGDTAGSYVLAIDGNKGNNGTFGAYAGGSIASGRNIGVALDLDTGTLVFYNNGVSLGTAYSGISGTFFPVVSVYGTQGGTANFNFGQRPFAYTPPTGFKALNTQNLPEPTIKKGNQYFDATLWTGDNTARNITNSGAMQPDLVWLKSRSTAGTSHLLVDAVRGANQVLQSDLTAAEATFANSITGFNSNGFALGTSAEVNLSPRTYVGWQWKESPSAGFDIVTYTGTGANRTVAHSLGVAPKMFICKNRTGAAGNWGVYNEAIGAANYLVLDGTNATINSPVAWNSTAPSSSVFTLGSGGFNTNGVNYVAYLFAEVAGFSKFGSYTGNGSADGAFVFTGFRPRYVMIKNISTTGDWWIVDTARSTVNVASAWLNPNLSNAESSAISIDLLSNGFKFRSAAGNDNGQNWIYAAFAESPFRNSLAR